jgi:hypothetical protein
MSKSFIDNDGDIYTVTPGESGHNLILEYRSPESVGTEFIIFKVEDADSIATMILDAAREARK